MALLASEILAIKYHLGYNVLNIGALPYVGIAEIFDRVIAPYMSAGAATTCSTTVTAPADLSSPSPVTLTLADATGFSVYDKVVLDVDQRQERVTVQNVSGNTITVILTKPHSGTYPISVEGGESMVRDILGKIQDVSNKLENAASTAGIREVDEIKFFGNDASSTNPISQLTKLRQYWRSELCMLLFGVGDLSQVGGRPGGGRVEMY